MGLAYQYLFPVSLKGNDRTRNQIRQKIESIFQNEGFCITTEINKVKIDFLDVILDLDTHQHWPYRKPGDTPRYINVMSNYPPAVIKENG